MDDPLGIDHGDQAFFLISAALVQLMTPGLAFFYGGLISESSVVNTLMLCFGTMGVVSVLWSLVGYSLAFGPSVSTGVIGDLSLSLTLFGDQIRAGTTVSEHTFFAFQLMFAIITPSIISGAVVRRIRFLWFMAFVSLWHIFVYCPLAHWIFYTNGWLAQYGALDFAGGMVIHTASGVSAFVLAFWMGKPKRPIVPAQPHNVPFVLLGAALLWFGWFGFNAGSAITSGATSARAFVNTQLATCAAMIVWAGCELSYDGRPPVPLALGLPASWAWGRITAVGAACAMVTGLVAITPACGFVTPMWALFVGGVSAAAVFFVLRLLRGAGVVDVLDVFAIHGIGGICGSLLTGLFAVNHATGSFEGNGVQIVRQLVSVLVTVLMSAVGTTVIFWALWATARACSSNLHTPEELLQHQDQWEHGEAAYAPSAGTAGSSAPTEDAAGAGISTAAVAVAMVAVNPEDRLRGDHRNPLEPRGAGAEKPHGHGGAHSAAGAAPHPPPPPPPPLPPSGGGGGGFGTRMLFPTRSHDMSPAHSNNRSLDDNRWSPSHANKSPSHHNNQQQATTPGGSVDPERAARLGLGGQGTWLDSTRGGGGSHKVRPTPIDTVSAPLPPRVATGKSNSAHPSTNVSAAASPKNFAATAIVVVGSSSSAEVAHDHTEAAADVCYYSRTVSAAATVEAAVTECGDEGEAGAAAPGDASLAPAPQANASLGRSTVHGQSTVGGGGGVRGGATRGSPGVLLRQSSREQSPRSGGLRQGSGGMRPPLASPLGPPPGPPLHHLGSRPVLFGSRGSRSRTGELEEAAEVVSDEEEPPCFVYGGDGRDRGPGAAAGSTGNGTASFSDPACVAPPGEMRL